MTFTDPNIHITDLENDNDQVCLICKRQAKQRIIYGGCNVTICHKDTCKFKAIDLVYAAECNWLE